MCQNECNDYSLLTANTGIGSPSTANNNLDGSGALVIAFTAGAQGSIIKSVTIKAIGQVTSGMVRLFIGTMPGNATLYKEVPVPTTPEMAQTPIPAPILQTFEIVLTGDIKLQAGFKLFASTQNEETFQVIVEGLDWDYPGTLPDTCCNFKQEVGLTGHGKISIANTNLDGTGAITNVFTATPLTNGALIKSITIKALQTTNLGMVRFFISTNGTTYFLMREVSIPATVQSGFQPSFKYVLDEPFYLQEGYNIGASTHIGQAFAINVEGVTWTYPI